MERRDFIGMAGTAVLVGVGVVAAAPASKNMYGLIGKMTAIAGKRDELIAILLDGVSGMPGCLSYIVAKDPASADDIWITEVWEDQASHKASLDLISVKAAIAKGRPLIAAFGSHTTTTPVGGHGLDSKKKAK